MLKVALICLALNVYHEARGEPELGQIAVAHVTQNRVRDKGTNICTEVFRPHQFSWTLRHSYRVPYKNDESWKQALRIAQTFNSHKDPTNGSLYFSSEASLKRRVKGITIGNHIFYKLK